MSSPRSPSTGRSIPARCDGPGTRAATSPRAARARGVPARRRCGSSRHRSAPCRVRSAGTARRPSSVRRLTVCGGQRRPGCVERELAAAHSACGDELLAAVEGHAHGGGPRLPELAASPLDQHGRVADHLAHGRLRAADDWRVERHRLHQRRAEPFVLAREDERRGAGDRARRVRRRARGQCGPPVPASPRSPIAAMTSASAAPAPPISTSARSPSSTAIMSISTACPLCGCVIAGYTRYGRWPSPNRRRTASIAAASTVAASGTPCGTIDDSIGGDMKGVDDRPTHERPMERRRPPPAARTAAPSSADRPGGRREIVRDGRGTEGRGSSAGSAVGPASGTVPPPWCTTSAVQGACGEPGVFGEDPHPAPVAVERQALVGYRSARSR